MRSSNWLGEMRTAETTSATRCPFVSKNPRIIATGRFAVVCLASAPYKEPLNDGVCAAIAMHEIVRRLPEWVNHPNLAAGNPLRASERLARARLCFELSGSRPALGLVAIS